MGDPLDYAWTKDTMPQTHAARVAKRPAYATLKNRKKELRRKGRSATTDAEIARINEAWIEAGNAYRANPLRSSAAQRAWHAKRDIAAAWRALDTNTSAPPCGDESCPAATSPKCRCRCGGANHGVALSGHET